MHLKINLNRDKFKEIDNAFSVLQEDINNAAACNIIKENLESCFGYKFNVSVIPITDTAQPFFVMSVYPAMDTVTKIITTLSSNDDKKEIAPLSDVEYHYIRNSYYRINDITRIK